MANVNRGNKENYLPVNIKENVQSENFEAKTIYLLLPKDVPVSRAERVQWLFDHLNKFIEVPNNSIEDTKETFAILSVVPWDSKSRCNNNRFLVTYRTEVKFLAQSYKFVYCLDMSPSHANVDIRVKEFLYDQVLDCFKMSLTALLQKFRIANCSVFFQPLIYLTIIINTPFLMNPAQQVVLKGVNVKLENLDSIIAKVEYEFYALEEKIAQVCAEVLNGSNNPQEYLENFYTYHQTHQNINNESKVPLVTPDANFVNMLRYSMLAISLLPENALSHVIIITDGTVAMPDSNVTETLLHQLHYDSIALSFIIVGSNSYSNGSAGFIAYIDLLRFLAYSTSGSCIKWLSDIVQFEPALMNVFQTLFFFWTYSTNRFQTLRCDQSQKSVRNNGSYNQQLAIGLSKKQNYSRFESTFLLLLSRRMREGFLIDSLWYQSGNLEIKLIHPWKSFIHLQCKLTCLWPQTSNLTYVEINICAPYEFLHDMTCQVKKKSKSIFRKAIIQRIWSRLSQIAVGDLKLANHITHFENNKNWNALTNIITSGIPLFNLVTASFRNSPRLTINPSLDARDSLCPLVSAWQDISQIESYHWRKWFHTYRITLMLMHDTPLPNSLYMSNWISPRSQVIQCRGASAVLYGTLNEWASVVLIENHTYVKFIEVSNVGNPIGFCLLRPCLKLPTVVLNISFSTAITEILRHQIWMELMMLLRNRSLSLKLNTQLFIFLKKPLERILIRYEKVPTSYKTIIFPDGTQPPLIKRNEVSSSNVVYSRSLFTTLSRYLYHKRWIWHANYLPNPGLLDASVSKILNILTRMRLEEGFHFAYSLCGIVTMVLEVSMEFDANCIIQYVLFPPHYNFEEEGVNNSDDENETIGKIKTELQMVTEIWIEPQYGKVTSTDEAVRMKYINNKDCYQIVDVIKKTDYICINVLFTLQYMILMCRDKEIHNNFSLNEHDGDGLDGTAKNSVPQSSNQHLNETELSPQLASRITYVPFNFDLSELLRWCPQTELIYSMLTVFQEDYAINRNTFDKLNDLFLQNIFKNFLLLHDRSIELSLKESENVTLAIVERHKNVADSNIHNCPFFSKMNAVKSSCIYQWKCYIKAISQEDMIITFLPASIEDIKQINACDIDNVNEDLNNYFNSDATIPEIKNFNKSNSSSSCDGMSLPIFVYYCSVNLLEDIFIRQECKEYSFCPGKDAFEDYRFNNNTAEDVFRLFNEDNNLLKDVTNSMQHCKILTLTYSKCYIESIFFNLHRGISIQKSDIDYAMALCEANVTEIDITQFMKNMCRHIKQCDSEEIPVRSFYEASPCMEIKNLHTLIKNRFSDIIRSFFYRVPSHGEYYFYKGHCNLKSFDEDLIITSEDDDNDDDVLQSAARFEEIRFGKREMSLYSEYSDVNFPSEQNFLNKNSIEMNNIRPLFIRLVCTLKLKSGEHLSKNSFKVLPTCIGELIQELECERSKLLINKADIQITLDVVCFTLPTNMDKIFKDRVDQSVNNISVPVQNYTTSISEDSSNSDERLSLQNLMDTQKKSIENLFEEIKWFLQDEICTALLDSKYVTENILNYVTEHISKNQTIRASCKLEKINLNFISNSSHNRQIFLSEFENLSLPIEYKLCRQDNYYYIAKQDRQNGFDDMNKTYIDICLDGNTSCDITTQRLQNQEINRFPSNFERNNLPDDSHSIQSEISHNSIVGTEAGYDEDISEDEEDYRWLINLGMKRPHLPNFWLILKIEECFIQLYFHCRFLEFENVLIKPWGKIVSVVKGSIADLCRRVNQLLLLTLLYETRMCNSLLEPANNDSKEDKWNSESNTIRKLDRNLPCPEDISTQNFEDGAFSCPIVWETIFILHPRLKTCVSSKFSASRGITTLRNALEKLSVLNRANMFVYKDRNDNIYYLKLYENSNLTASNKQMNEYDSSTFSRSPSVLSLPIAHNFAHPNTSLHQVSFINEKENQAFDSPNDSKENLNFNEGILTLKVHGISEVGVDIQCDLLQVLQNRLEEAVLDLLSIMLARNSMCPLTPDDVKFIQKPLEEPDHIINLEIENMVLKSDQRTEYFLYYLKQNLLQFLNIPRYTDGRHEYHFKDYVETNDSLPTNSDNIFIYNQNPSAGSLCIACLILTLVNNCPSHSSNNDLDKDLENAFITQNYENLIQSTILDKNISTSYLQFRLWKRGKIHLENLKKKLILSVKQATWDIVTECYLLSNSLCVREYGDDDKLKMDLINVACMKNELDKPIEFICNFTMQRNKLIESKAQNSFNRKLNNYNSSRKYSDKNDTLVVQNVTDDIQKGKRKNDIHEGAISTLHSQFLFPWLEFAYSIYVPAVKKYIIKIENPHPPFVIVKELIPLLEDSPRVFKALPTNTLKKNNKNVYVSYIESNWIQEYIIIPRNLANGKNVDLVNFDTSKLKQCPKSGLTDDMFLARQKFYWISVNNEKIVIYTYNWIKEEVEKLINITKNLANWFSVRSCFLSSIISQKLGLFHNQLLTRKCSMLSTNNYYQFIGNVDVILKFPKISAQKKSQTVLNLSQLLESFRDTICKTNYVYNDIVMAFTMEMKEIKILEKKNRDEIKKLHFMYPSKTAMIKTSQLNALMQHSRITHYVCTPLLFHPEWRLKVALSNNNTILSTEAIKFLNIPTEDWHNRLCSQLCYQYTNYLYELGFTALLTNDSVPMPNYHIITDNSIYMSTQYIQRTLLGGRLIFALCFEAPYFIVKLYGIECAKLHNITSKIAINGFTSSLLDEYDKIKDLMHIHSFAYDYQLRSIYNYISRPAETFWIEKYDVNQFLDDFSNYYIKTPNYISNLLHSGNTVIDDLLSEGKQLYDYLVLNVNQYGFNVLEINSNTSEYILMKIINMSKEIFMPNFPDFNEYKNVKMLLMVYNFNGSYKPTDNALHLKYNLLLISNSSETNSLLTNGQLGTFDRMSLSTIRDIQTFSSNNVKEKFDRVEFNNSLVSDVTSDFESNLIANLRNIICEESVYYLGYYTPHEQCMHDLILNRDKYIQMDILNMVSKGIISCRTNLLWNRLILAQDLDGLSFDEFVELKNIAQLESLYVLQPNLRPLLNQPLSWFQGLAKSLLVKYVDRYRMFSSADNCLTYIAILHPRYYGAFMLLSLDSHTNRGEIFMVYREAHKQEDTDLLGLGYEKSLTDGFVNCICFYLWSGMIPN